MGRGEGREREERVEEGREKWERKKRDEKVGTFFALPRSLGFCVRFFNHQSIPVPIQLHTRLLLVHLVH
jgi:hypothetical protein